MPKIKRQVSRRPTTNGTKPTAEFNPDYTFVKQDLKRIGILASTFFVLLIALSFFLR